MYSLVGNGVGALRREFETAREAELCSGATDAKIQSG